MRLFRTARNSAACAVAASALVCLASPVSAPASGSTADRYGRCAGPAGSILAANRHAVVWRTRSGVFYACAARAGRRHALGRIDGARGDVLEIALTGRFVAWERAVCDISSTCIGEIVVRDLRRGTLREAPIPPQQRTAASLAVTRSGTAVWIRRGAPGTATYEVRALDAHGERVLDGGDRIAPNSLAVAGSRAYWMNGESPRSVLLAR